MIVVIKQMLAMPMHFDTIGLMPANQQAWSRLAHLWLGTSALLGRYGFTVVYIHVHNFFDVVVPWLMMNLLQDLAMMDKALKMSITQCKIYQSWHAH